MAAKAYTYRSGPPRLRPLLGGVDYLFPSPPSISSISPTTAAVGATVTVNGTGLTDTTGVTVNGTSVVSVVLNDSQVTFTVPGTASSGAVTVATPIGVATAPTVLTVTAGSSGGITPPAGFTTFYEDQYASNAAGRWSVYNESTFGADTLNMRIQRYMTANTVFGAGSAGSTGGTSLRMLVKRNNPNPSNEFSAGMVDSKSAGYFYPRYGYYEFRTKTPHGHGVWPAWWMTAKNGGGGMVEWDVQEYFHGQLPGKNSTTMHSRDNSGAFMENRYKNNLNRTYFETPTYTPQWHKWATEILPVTDATGNTIGDVTQPSAFVRLRILLDGVEAYRLVDSQALYWTTNGGTEDSFWNIYIQGSQISGKFVGHPDGPLAYSQQLGGCVNGGTAPDSCSIQHGTAPNGAPLNVQRAGAPGSVATMSDPATTYEVDYFYCAKYTG